MKAKQIKLLKKQIARLEEKDFNLEVWKNTTIIILERIFGKNSTEISQISGIKQDMSSWSLRDTLGEAIDKSKLLGKQILEICIDELELSVELTETEKPGLPAGRNVDSSFLDVLKNELKGSQYQTITSILEKNIDKVQKNKELKSILEKLNKSELLDIIIKFLL